MCEGSRRLMEIKKNTTAVLEDKRPLWWLMGLIVALTAVVVALEYTSRDSLASLDDYAMEELAQDLAFMPPEEDRSQLKVALSWTDDIHQLHRRRDFLPGRFFELQRYVQAIGIEDLSLQKLYANVFGEKISKTQQLSNWEAPSLTQAQKLYAATDAWACIRLYDELKRLQHEGFEIISEEG